jgi:hypothetical protein
MAATVLKERTPAKTARKKRTFVAKPVRGKINFKALRQGIIGRFPKAIAYLAK